VHTLQVLNWFRLQTNSSTFTSTWKNRSPIALLVFVLNLWKQSKYNYKLNLQKNTPAPWSSRGILIGMEILQAIRFIKLHFYQSNA
jgi:hypothetical protein